MIFFQRVPVLRTCRFITFGLVNHRGFTLMSCYALCNRLLSLYSKETANHTTADPSSLEFKFYETRHVHAASLISSFVANLSRIITLSNSLRIRLRVVLYSYLNSTLRCPHTLSIVDNSVCGNECGQAVLHCSLVDVLVVHHRPRACSRRRSCRSSCFCSCFHQQRRFSCRERRRCGEREREHQLTPSC